MITYLTKVKMLTKFQEVEKNIVTFNLMWISEALTWHFWINFKHRNLGGLPCIIIIILLYHLIYSILFVIPYNVVYYRIS